MRIENRSPFKPRPKPGMQIENKTSQDETTLYLYNEIGYFGIMAMEFIKELNNAKAKTVHIRFNSPGGSVFDGNTIYNAIKDHPSKIVAHIDGLAASIASVIVMAADEIEIAENAMFMLHHPWSMVIGTSDTMRHEADLLDKVGGTIMKTYMDRTGKSEKEITEWMDAETWFTAEEALENGFVNYVNPNKTTDEKAKATRFDLSVFANVPDQLKGDNKKPPTARELEKILKDSGFSGKQAKEILAKGFQDESLRDVEPVLTPQVRDSQRDVEEPAPRDVEEAPKNQQNDLTANKPEALTDNYDVLKLLDTASKATSRAEGGN